MKIGVPKEVKPQENRIGLTPESVKTLVGEGHEVLVENNGGFEAGFDNDQWEALSNSTVIISEENSQLLIEDASNAGLNIKCFSDISMLDVFPKNN